MRVIDAVKGQAHTVVAGTPLREVARLFATEGLRAVIVTDPDGGPVGIVTERDLVVRGLAFGLSLETPVDAVMSLELVTADPAASTRSVYRLLHSHGIRQVPLVESGRLVGIVERDDLADEATAEALASVGSCPHCKSLGLRPVSTDEATNFVCLWCRGCWRLEDGVLIRVEPRSCAGCEEHNFCRFPLIDYGLNLPTSPAVR